MGELLLFVEMGEIESPSESVSTRAFKVCSHSFGLK